MKNAHIHQEDIDMKTNLLQMYVCVFHRNWFMKLNDLIHNVFSTEQNNRITNLEVSI